MKPADLKSPFSLRERFILIRDKILYYPKCCDPKNFSFPGWEDPAVFGRKAPIMLEYCSGNGNWIVEKALSHPEYNWVALEMDFERVRKINSKRHNFKVVNLFIICGEALLTSKHYFSENSISKIFINFPDPWPKRRHAKYRLIQEPFINELQRALKKEGSLTFVTDDAPYSQQFIKTMQRYSMFSSAYCEPYYIHDYPGYGSSRFENIWRGQGKDIFYHQYNKI